MWTMEPKGHEMKEVQFCDICMPTQMCTAPEIIYNSNNWRKKEDCPVTAVATATALISYIFEICI